MRTPCALLSAAVGLSVTLPASAVDRLVPGTYATIQAAIDAAANGDHVVVADGTYTGVGNVNIDTLGKSIVVRSANGPEQCILSGMDVLGDHAFVLNSHEPPSTSINGFTIEHFHTTHAEPGAIRVLDASVELKNLIYRHNSTALGDGGPTVSGSALYVEGTPVNRFCQYIENEGAPVMLADGTMYILNSVFDGNVARGSAAGAAENHSFLLIFFSQLRNNSVTADTGVAKGGAVAHFGNALDLTDCHFDSNSATGPDGGLGAAVYLENNAVINGNTFRNHAGAHSGGTVAIVSTGQGFSVTMSGSIESSSVGGLLVNQDAGAITMNLHSGVFCNNAPYDINGDVAFFGSPTFCAPGDVNGDGTVDVEDRVVFCGALGSDAGEPAYLPGADMNDDGAIDEIDQQLFNDILPTCLGDLVASGTFAPPGDGMIDGADLAILLGAWGNNASCADLVNSKTFAAPPDGVVDGADLAVLLGAWGQCR